MQKHYVSKTTINMANYELYIRSGDILVHDPSNNNKLTVYRNGSIVKIIQQTPLGIAVMIKNGFIEPISAPTPAPAPQAPVSPPAKKVVVEVPKKKVSVEKGTVIAFTEEAAEALNIPRGKVVPATITRESIVSEVGTPEAAEDIKVGQFKTFESGTALVDDFKKRRAKKKLDIKDSTI